MIDLRRRDGAAAGLRRGLAPPRRRLRVAALRRHAGPRAPARAVDHDADDARVRARGAARLAGRGGAGRARAGRRCAATSATPCTAAGSRRSAAPDDKRAYEHVFVVLAAASAGDAELLGEALEVLETHFWDERAGALVDVCNRDWTDARGLPRRQREHARRRGDARDRRPAVARAGGAGHAAAGRRQPSAAERALRRRAGGRCRTTTATEPGAPVPALRRDDRALVRVGAAGLHARCRPLRGRRAAAVRGRRARRLGRQRVRLHRRLGRPAGRAPTGCTGCCARRSRAAAVLGEDALQARVVGARRARASSTARTARGGTSSTRPTARRRRSGTASRTSTTRCRRR